MKHCECLLNGGRRPCALYQGFEASALPDPVPRVLPKNEDPNLVSRNKRMLGNLLLGTLEVFV